jgi:hypothetical protein
MPRRNSEDFALRSNDGKVEMTEMDWIGAAGANAAPAATREISRP